MSTEPAHEDGAPPSRADRERLAADLRDQLDSTRLAWDAALLRSDAALQAGDEDQVRSALDDHRRLLEVLESRVGEVVASATAERERAAEGSASVRPEPVPSPRRAALRRLPSLVGAAAALVLVAGAVATELPTTAAGAIAGATSESSATTVGPASSELEPRTVDEQVRGTPLPAPEAGETVERQLPLLEASDAAAVARPRPDGDAAPTADDDAAPTADDDAPSNRPTAPPLDTGPEVEAPTSHRPTSVPEILDRLRDHAGPADQEVGSSLPDALRGLTEGRRRPAIDGDADADGPPAPDGPASDPTVALR